MAATDRDRDGAEGRDAQAARGPQPRHARADRHRPNGAKSLIIPRDIAEQEREALDEWCVKQLAMLSEKMLPYIMARGDLKDPEYRQQLGQHQAFMRMRSYLHGSRLVRENITPTTPESV